MQIKKLNIKGFRCLVDLIITFEQGLTLIVGENDSGKTSLVECLKVITQNRTVELDDFHHDGDSIFIEVTVDDFVFIKEYKRKDGNISEEKSIQQPSDSYLSAVHHEVQLFGDNDISPQQEERIKEIARSFSIPVRANSKVSTLKNKILEQVNSSKDGNTYEIENAKFPSFNNIQLDGVQFENISAFFKEVFLREKQADIWREKISDSEDTTLEGFVKNSISTYSGEITKKIVDTGLLTKMQLTLTFSESAQEQAVKKLK